ncbi:hypothetical protein EYF80_024702 [Liparis tanakae]|uniref:Uncharacterized protein n=1 Tax=Liparis tanakae TaxID=230148 RepID=A0A4Z2HJH8_9TELE|nr:hypothetical protein EYF80_024702 [Liparis tanakae]
MLNTGPHDDVIVPSASVSCSGLVFRVFFSSTADQTMRRSSCMNAKQPASRGVSSPPLPERENHGIVQSPPNMGIHGILHSGINTLRLAR